MTVLTNGLTIKDFTDFALVVNVRVIVCFFRSVRVGIKKIIMKNQKRTCRRTRSEEILQQRELLLFCLFKNTAARCHGFSRHNETEKIWPKCFRGS